MTLWSRFLCMIHLHRWSVWGVPDLERFEGLQFYRQATQTRQCLDCGAADIRRFGPKIRDT